MKRRAVITLLGGAAVWPLAARAQQIAIGFLHSGSQRLWAHATKALHDSLKEAGYTEGQNLTVEYRWADDQFDRLPVLAANLASHRPSLIVVGGGSIAAHAAKSATSTIPIIFAIGSSNGGDGSFSTGTRPAADPAMSAVPPKAEVNPDIGICRDGVLAGWRWQTRA
jgi:putative ABC transport system substrate-binding protein